VTQRYYQFVRSDNDNALLIFQVRRVVRRFAGLEECAGNGPQRDLSGLHA
jgi:hypothetical protein